MRILRPLQRGHARILGIGLIAAFAAGCSSDTSRFGNDPFANPFNTRSEVTNTAPAPQPQQPVAQIESRPLDTPVAYNPPRTLPAAPAPSMAQQQPLPVQSTGSAQRDGNWRWDGGTAITVQRGETLEIISRRYNVPVAIILRANNLATATLVQPGQRLVIPSNGERAQPLASALVRPAAIHTVNPGDTLLSVARRYKIGAAELARENKLTVTTKLKLGQKLTIPGTSRAATQPAAAPQRRVETPVQATPAPQEKVAAVKPVEQIEAQPALTGTPQFRWPVKGRVISGFGSKPNGQQNDGINLSVPEGTPVKASEDGVVAYAGNELKGYGNLVLIRHAEGWVTAYAHTSEVLVKRGEAVKRGQVVARAGQTGGVVAPQLHFEIRKGSTPVDPTQHLSSL
ncbi:MAG TPA: peptidoglycan DD-metalloendopeptidase family protein [Xanthobacteraceae bacterium]|nr:peptidoglycan DD-metalloendopeptidase family protein [Xanthobacteraceae bacterium]